MGFFSNLFSSGVSEVVDSVAKGIDSLFTSDEERLKAKNMLEQIKSNARLKDKELNLQYESELTKRLASDNQGNFLTKSARPITLFYMLGLITIMIFGAMFNIQIPDVYIDMVQILAMTVFGFYFGGKSLEAFKHGRVL